LLPIITASCVARHQVGARAGDLAGDPAALPRRRRDPPVERRRELERDERPPDGEAQQEAGIHLPRLVGAEPGLDRDAGGLEPRDAVA